MPLWIASTSCRSDQPRAHATNICLWANQPHFFQCHGIEHLAEGSRIGQAVECPAEH